MQIIRQWFHNNITIYVLHLITCTNNNNHACQFGIYMYISIHTCTNCTSRINHYMAAVQPKNQPPTNLGGPTSWQLGCYTNDRLSSTRGLRANADLGGILRGEENLVTSTTPVRLSRPAFIAVIGEELPQIPGRDVRDHGTTYSLLINKQKILF